MKYCKVTGLNGRYNYNSDVLTIGTLYEIVDRHPTPNRYCIINNQGERWWVGAEVDTDEEYKGITWKNMVVFFNSIPSPLEVISV